MSVNIDKKVSDTVKSAPLSPGCYIFRDKQRVVLYVGKAIVLRNRLRNYITDTARLEIKIQNMVSQSKSVETIKTDTELEALILESNLIKKYKPKYNSMLKDDKNYIWLYIDTQHDFPKPIIVREKKFKQGTYYGPYPNTFPVKRLLRMMRRVFPYRTCQRRLEEVQRIDGKTVIKSSDPKPCLYYHLGLCNAPCAGLISSKAYKQNLKNVSFVFEGKSQALQENLKKEMSSAAFKQNYEEAALLRDKLTDLAYVQQRVHMDKNTDEIEYLKTKQDRNNRALTELIDNLKIDNEKPLKDFKIECYDISNISGTNAVGSMVSFTGGVAQKENYRKFKIQSKNTPDDFAMLQEVITRRIKKVDSDDKSFSTLPDLFVIDGGKGQLSSVLTILAKNNIYTPTIGLAKKEEEIIQMQESEGEPIFKTIKLSKRNDAVQLLQRIRDETHRFGITFHRSLRSKAQIVSGLDEIDGIGEITKKKLLKAFGSIAGIKKATTLELNAIIKNKSTVEKLKKLF